MRTAVVLASLIALLPSPTAACELDGPLAAAAQSALRTGDFTTIAIWVTPAHEAALQAAFRRARAAHDDELASCYFSEVAQRLHVASYGAVQSSSEPPEAIVELVVSTVRAGLRARLRTVRDKQAFRRGDVAAGRDYVASYIEFARYAAALFALAVTAPPPIEARERHEQ